MVEFKLKTEKLISSINIAKELDEHQLIFIGNEVAKGYDNDMA